MTTATAQHDAAASALASLATGQHAPRMVAVRSKYDAAQTHSGNARHWANADELSANAANTLEVRRRLRSRSRYEVANNCYALGMCLTLAHYIIGTGPRLQMQTDDADLNERVEKAFHAWCKRVRLAAKLRTMRQARFQDGEAFALLSDNYRLPGPVKLDVRLVECDQFSDGRLKLLSESEADGIRFDRFGNPLSYQMLQDHPGSQLAATDASTAVPAEHVIHWFREDRPGQQRGIPEITPALPLFAQLRRYTLAVVRAAEAVAEWTLFLKTNAPAMSEDGEQLGPAEIEEGAFFPFEFERGMMTTLPEDWEPFQLKAEQPSSTYAEFKAELLNEIARCVCMPFNIAACNSGGYNYASGRLDHQTFFRFIRIEQADAEGVVLDRIFQAWCKDAMLLTEFAQLRRFSIDVPHAWYWQGYEHVDPTKEANAQATRLGNLTTTLAAEYAAAGKDWEAELRQIAREAKFKKELKLTDTEAAPKPVGVASDKDEDEDDEDES